MDIDQKNGAADKPLMAGPLSAELSAKGLARRRFGRVGIGASGVIVTLASPSAMAASIARAPSGCDSIGPKSYHGAGPVSAGRPPEEWAAQSSWPSPCAPERRFGADFSCLDSAYGDRTYAQILRLEGDEVSGLNNGNSNNSSNSGNGSGNANNNNNGNHIYSNNGKDNGNGKDKDKDKDKHNSASTSTVNSEKNKIAQLCAAAMLNVRAGYSTFLTEGNVQDIWREYDSHGIYKPNATQEWNAFSIASYLTGTMDGKATANVACGV